MKTSKKQNFVHTFAVNLFMVVVIVITPWYSYDSINIPKVTLLVLFGGVGMIYILTNFKYVFLQRSITIKAIVTSSILSFLLTFTMSDTPFVQQLYGREGRSNGLLTYISLLVVLLVFSNLNLEAISIKLNQKIAVAGLFVIIYSYFQVAGLDPFNWQTQNLQMFATLGNPNFLSSYIGIAMIPIMIMLIGIFQIKSKLAKSILCVAVFATIINLIYLSKSYQGYFVVASALASWLLIYTVKLKNKIWFIIILLASLTGFAISLFGLLNRGFLSSILYKGSITSRGDFFRAAVEMGRSNWVNGLGFDSFSDYYLKFRDDVATGRPNGEFTDSAHNYFLDIFANFGVPFLVIYLLITLITLKVFIYRLRKPELDFKLISIFTVWLGLQLQSLISPTNFVFSILIFSISGLLIGDQKVVSEVIEPIKISKMSNFAIVIGVVISTLLMGPLINRDHKILVAYNGDSAEKVISAINLYPKSTVSYNRVLPILVRSNLNRETLDVARNAANFNKRSSLPNYLILTSDLSSKIEKIQAYNNLREIDPNNNFILSLKP
jgi:hypothetical protein